MQYWGTVKVSDRKSANIYLDDATGMFRYYVQGQHHKKAKWSEDFETFVDAAEAAQSDWLNNPERDEI